MRQGIFIVVDGADGTGKTTAMHLLAERLRERGMDVVTTREPGGSPFAEKIRAIVLDPANDIDTIQQLMLMNVSRRSHIRETINPALERGAIVLCDRFVASTLTLQTVSREGGTVVSEDDVVDVHRRWCDGMAPDMMLHVHAPDEVRIERRAVRSGHIDRFERNDAEYHRRVADRYFSSGAKLGFRTVDVDASGDIESVVGQMDRAVEALLAERLRDGIGTVE